jgi:hypothetical protein
VTDQRVIVFPLRSNANSLVAGSGVAALRRRVMAASLVYDTVFLEQGRLEMTVGPRGSSALSVPDEPDATWQTPAQRSVKNGPRFSLSISPHDPTLAPGQAPAQMTQVLESAVTYHWDATFAPFAREVPPGQDWLNWLVSDIQGKGKQLAAQWSRRDMDNPALRRQWPDTLVRSAIVQHVNRDLVIAAANRVAVSQDPLHRRVYVSRYRAESGWRPDGFALPVVVPTLGRLGWKDVAELRAHPGMVTLRRVLWEVEQQAVEEAQGGDLEAAARHAFTRYLASAAAPQRSKVAGIVREHAASLVVAGVIGAVTVNWGGLLGFGTGVALGEAPGLALDVVRYTRARSRPSWVTAFQAIQAVSA